MTEIVPPELQENLHWDERHDRMAELIMAEFKLGLPRDRARLR